MALECYCEACEARCIRTPHAIRIQGNWVVDFGTHTCVSFRAKQGRSHQQPYREHFLPHSSCSFVAGQRTLLLDYMSTPNTSVSFSTCSCPNAAFLGPNLMLWRNPVCGRHNFVRRNVSTIFYRQAVVCDSVGTIVTLARASAEGQSMPVQRRSYPIGISTLFPFPVTILSILSQTLVPLASRASLISRFLIWHGSFGTTIHLDRSE